MLEELDSSSTLPIFWGGYGSSETPKMSSMSLSKLYPILFLAQN